MVLPSWRGGHNPKAKAAAAKMPIPAIAMAVGSYAGSINIAGSSKSGLNTPDIGKRDDKASRLLLPASPLNHGP